MSKKKIDSAIEIMNLLSPEENINALPYMETGEVISPLPNLKVRLRNIEYRKENIKLNEYWTKGHKRKIIIPHSKIEGIDASKVSHVSGGFPDAEIIFNDELKVGDLVAVMQSKDKQTLYVLYRIAKF